MTDREAAAKDWLNRHEPIRNDIRALELQLEEMRANVNKTVASLQEVKVQTQPQNKQAEKIAEIVDFGKKIEEKKNYLRELDQVTLNTINLMNDPYKRIILVYRYIYHRSWSYIASKLHYKESYIYEMHLKALNSIYPLIDWSAD